MYKCYLENTVGVDFESNLNLRNSTRCWGNAGQVEFTQAEQINKF